jgi:HPt (histidine-containing phosphotransfer) domain-containing protein
MEATELIRRYEAGSGRSVPIVAMTAHAMKGDKEKCLAAGMDGYVSKPIQSKVLAEEILRVTRATIQPNSDSGEVASASTGPGIDRQELLSRVENDEALAREILSIFQTDAVSYRQNLRRAVETNSLDEVRKCAHAFKGMLANLAATAASTFASNLEQLAKAGKIEQFAPAWKDFDQELTRVLREVEALLAGAAQ